MDGDRSVTATFSLRPVFQFSAPSYSVSEDSGSATITVQRLGTTAGTATVDYAIEPGSATPPPAADADFSPSGGAGPLTGTLTFPPGQSTRSFTIPVVNDALVEGPETILLSLHNPTAGALLGAQPTAVLTIVDDDRAGTVQFSQATATAQEFASSVTLMVTRTGPTSSAASVPYHLAGKVTGVDTALTPLDGTVSFEPGQGSAPLVINLLNDPTQDGNAALTATLDTPSPGDLALGTPKPRDGDARRLPRHSPVRAADLHGRRSQRIRHHHAHESGRDGPAHHRALRHGGRRRGQRPRRGKPGILLARRGLPAGSSTGR